MKVRAEMGKIKGWRGFENELLGSMSLRVGSVASVDGVDWHCGE